MHEPVDARPSEADAEAVSIPCDCVCGETDEGDGGQVNKTVNYLPVYYDVNGEPAPDAD